MILPKKKVFQNIKIKLNSRTWMTQKSSVVIFQALELLQPHWPHRPQQPHWPLQPQKPYFTHKKNPGPDNWIIPGTKITNAGPFLWNGSSKSNFSLTSDTFSVGGCWGQPLLFFWKMVVVPKNSLSQHSRTIFKPNLTCISLSVRANL